MLLPDNIHPANSVYFNAAYVLRSITDHKPHNVVELYQEVRKNHKIGFSLYILCIDWLYLIDLVEINHKGEINYVSKKS